MAFIAKRTSTKTILEPDQKGGGNISVIQGKARATSSKAWKDEGTIKKGDTVSAIEFILEIADKNNIEFQLYQAGVNGDKGKYVPDPVPPVYPLKVSMTLTSNAGLAYLKLLSEPVLAGLPEGIIDGFSGTLNCSENNAADILAGVIPSKPVLDVMMFEGWQKVECKLDFPVASQGNYGKGASSQSEAEKLKDRQQFISELLTTDSEPSKLFIKLATAELLTLQQYLTILFS